MTTKTNKQIIISVGGSLIVPPTGIDWRFLKKFRRLILEQTKKGWRFFLVAGGGATARNYIDAADKIIKVTDNDRDWLGIHSTRLNAHLLRTIFRRQAYPEIIKNPTIHFPSNKPILVAGGWKPGWSTDYVATIIAQEYEIKTIINLSNIDYAYTADPRQDQNAKKIKNITWPEFRKLVGNKWRPGLSAPFDPIASAKAQQLDLTVIIMNGRRLKNLENYLAGKKFIGTVIKSIN